MIIKIRTNILGYSNNKINKKLKILSIKNNVYIECSRGIQLKNVKDNKW